MKKPSKERLMPNRNNGFSAGAVLIALALLTGLQFSCRTKDRNTQIAAKAGDAVLTREELLKRMNLEGLPRTRENETIENWINEELLVQEARRQGIEKTDELKWEMEKVEKQYLINQLIEKTFAEKIRITESNISDFYEKNRKIFEAEEDQVHLFQIMTKSQADAEMTLQEIKAGKSFEQAARDRSIDYFRDKGGDMGFVGRNDMIPELSRIAFGLAEGSLSSIIKSNQGFHILKIVKKHVKGETRDLQEVRDEISQRLRVDRERAIYYDLLYQLKNKQRVVMETQESSKSAEANRAK
jgi:peptidyl-prolyl cis-trans isomerase C